MRTIFNSALDVIHIFAQQTQSTGKSNNVFFCNNKIYSYGYHYLLAEFISNESGQQAIIINDKGYSATTAKHISYITQATRHYKQFYVMDICSKQVFYQLSDINNKLLKAKKPEKYILEAQRLLDCFRTFNEFSGSKKYESINYSYIDKINELSNDFNIQLNSEAIKKLQISQKNKKAADEAKKIASFTNFDADFIKLDFDILRLNKGIIETSQGVKLSIEQGLKLADMLKTGECLNDKHFLQYIIKKHTKENISIGCHNFKVKYLIQFANNLKK